MVNLGERLRTLRTERRITQTDMAKQVGITKVMISSYELEQRQPSYEVLIKLAVFFGVSTDYLLGNERERTVSVAGLSNREVEIINSMVEALRSK